MSEFDDIFTGPKKEPEEVSVPAFDKEEWVQQKKAEREKAYETIDQMAELMVTDGEHVKNYLADISVNHGDNFANAREVRNYFERSVERQATRVVSEPNIDANSLTTLKLPDVEE